MAIILNSSGVSTKPYFYMGIKSACVAMNKCSQIANMPVYDLQMSSIL